MIIGDHILHTDPTGRTKPQVDVLDADFICDDETAYLHGPIIGWVLASSVTKQGTNV